MFYNLNSVMPYHQVLQMWLSYHIHTSRPFQIPLFAEILFYFYAFVGKFQFTMLLLLCCIECSRVLEGPPPA